MKKRNIIPPEGEKSYEKHMEQLSHQASVEWTMKVDAEDKVKKQKTEEIAKALKDNGADIEIIMSATGLSKEEIERL